MTTQPLPGDSINYFGDDFGDDFAAGLVAGDGFFAASVATDAAGEATGVAAAGDTAAAGEGDGVAVGDGTGTVSDCKIELEPLMPGSDNVNAISMKAIAAPIVIFARMFCVPRGPNAVLDTLLVNKAPASALPGCNNTTTISTRQERINNEYRM